MKNAAKLIFKVFGASLLLIMLGCCLSKPVAAETFSENGDWYRKINGKYWYFSINDYTSPMEGEKAAGVVYIYKGKKSYKNRKNWVGYGQYYKKGTNKYVLKYKGVKIWFTVKEKTISVKQTKGKIKGIKLKGKFKLKKRHYA